MPDEQLEFFVRGDRRPKSLREEVTRAGPTPKSRRVPKAVSNAIGGTPAKGSVSRLRARGTRIPVKPPVGKFPGGILGKGFGVASVASLLILLLTNMADAVGFGGPETRRLKFDEKVLAASQASEAAHLRIGERQRITDRGDERVRAAERQASLRAILQTQENIAGASVVSATNQDAIARLRALTEAGAVGPHNQASASLGYF